MCLKSSSLWFSGSVVDQCDGIIEWNQWMQNLSGAGHRWKAAGKSEEREKRQRRKRSVQREGEREEGKEGERKREEREGHQCTLTSKLLSASWECYIVTWQHSKSWRYFQTFAIPISLKLQLRHFLLNSCRYHHVRKQCGGRRFWYFMGLSQQSGEREKASIEVPHKLSGKRPPQIRCIRVGSQGGKQLILKL